uniref:Uncharacterized protein n=1 Tax=Ditylenchus dipsaci TaxID=166011 RepID=A0A915CVV4_9BILA
MASGTKNPTNRDYQAVNTQEEKEENDEKPTACGKLFLHASITFAISLATGLSWACGRQFTKTALNIDATRFYAPYFLVWFNTCFMSICYPVFIIYNKTFNGISVGESHLEASKVFGQDGLNLSSFLRRTTLFLVLWMAPNYTYSHALGYISASAAFCIVSSNVAIVCVLGWIILKTKFSLLQSIAAIFAVLGVTVISADKEFAGNAFGIALAIFCAFSSALYKVLFKLIIGNASLGRCPCL